MDYSPCYEHPLDSSRPEFRNGCEKENEETSISSLCRSCYSPSRRCCFLINGRPKKPCLESTVGGVELPSLVPGIFGGSLSRHEDTCYRAGFFTSCSVPDKGLSVFLRKCGRGSACGWENPFGHACPGLTTHVVSKATKLCCAQRPPPVGNALSTSKHGCQFTSGRFLLAFEHLPRVVSFHGEVRRVMSIFKSDIPRCCPHPLWSSG